MKISEDNTYKIAVIDFVTILLAILVISLCISGFLSLIGWRNSGEFTAIEYKVTLYEVRADMKNNIRIGDSVIDSVGKYNIGTVENIQFENSVITVYSDINNEMKSVAVSDLYDITLTITAEAKINSSEIKIDGYTLKIGKTMYMRFPYFVSEGICTGIKGDI